MVYISRLQAPPEDCEQCPIRPHTVYAPASTEELGILQKMRRRTATYDARQLILRENEVPAEIFTLVQGWAFRFKLLPDGRRQILCFLLPGDTIELGVLRGEPLPFSVQALTDVSLCAFPTQKFTDFLRERAHLAWNFGLTCSMQSRALDCRITDLGRRTALERVSGFLLHVEDRLRRRDLVDGDTFPFPLRQEHIADALGLTNVHVSRTMAILRDGDLVTVRGGTAVIHDRDKLAETAGFVPPLRGGPQRAEPPRT